LPVLLPLFVACFLAGVAFRLIDPLVPQIAREFSTTPAMAALLSTAYTLPYAVALPFIGGFGDAFGKVRMIKICFAGMLATTFLAAMAWSYEMLFAARVLGGISGGSIIPLALAVVGDRYPIAERQVALSKLLMAMLTSQVFGMSAAGIIADAYGWRAVVWVLAISAVAGMAYTYATLKPRENVERHSLSFGRIVDGYLHLLSLPKARWCFTASALNGLIVFGLLPWIAIILELTGAGSIREAGLIIAGMGVGGFAYTFWVRGLLALTGGVGMMMAAGGFIAAAGLVLTALFWAWYMKMFAFAIVGFGFFMFHGSVQTVVSEVSPAHRGAAVAVHSTAFIGGQAIGPIIYAGTVSYFGVTSTFVLAAIGIALLSIAVSTALSDRPTHLTS
jgi:predicted MFS family arabinose efflux permease